MEEEIRRRFRFLSYAPIIAVSAKTGRSIERLKEKAKDKKWSKEVKSAFDKEISKLQRINPAAAEYSVILNYVDVLLDLPWEEFTDDKFDLKRAIKVLDKDHYGLDKIKDRILEYLAVLKLKGDLKSPIILKFDL